MRAWAWIAIGLAVVVLAVLVFPLVEMQKGLWVRWESNLAELKNQSGGA